MKTNGPAGKGFLYFSTFLTGLSEPVLEMMQDRISDLKVVKAVDGLVIYRTQSKGKYLKKLPFLTNTFEVLDWVPQAKSLLAFAETLPRKLNKGQFRGNYDPRNTFKLMVLDKNQPSALPRGLHQRIAQKITALTGLKENRQKGDFEIYIHYRREGIGLLSVKFANRGKAAPRAKGALRQDLVEIMVWLSRPVKGEVVLDPFAGSGAIPVFRAQSGPKGLILAGEIDSDLQTALKAKVKSLKLNDRVVVKKADFLDAEAYKTGSIDKIVTDPPWGHFAAMEDPKVFFQQLVERSLGVMKDRGRMVVLMGVPELFLEVLEQFPAFQVSAQYRTLVQGKKATLFVLDKGTAS